MKEKVKCYIYIYIYIYISRKIIRIKLKAMFVEKTDDPAVKETFISSNVWMQFYEKTSSLIQVNIYFIVLIINRDPLRKFVLVH